MSDRTADSAYQEHREAIDSHIRAIRALLDDHGRAQATEPRNWGYAGDLAHVRGELADIAKGLAGEDR
tara:strand:+ start:24 stop:227 length:204 start_codon:yes stop_codon:yes gene_type:complete